MASNSGKECNTGTIQSKGAEVQSSQLMQTSNSMIKAVDQLENVFRSVNAEVTALDKRLDAEFSYMINDEGMVENLTNPTKVMKRLQEVKVEFSKLREEASQLQQFQVEAVNNFKIELDKLSHSLNSIHNRVIPEQMTSNEVLEQDQELTKRLSSVQARN